MPVHRITILGPCGSGKSTLASKLSSNLSIPLLHLDEIFWTGTWEERSKDSFTSILRSLISPLSEWVIDGNHIKDTSIHWPRTTLFIYLDLPIYLVFWRLLKRTLWRCWTGERLFGTTGCVESFRMGFMSRDSILLYCVKFFWEGKGKKIVELIEEEVRGRKDVGFVICRTDRDVDELVRGLMK